MASELIVSILFIFSFLASLIKAQPPITYDVTKYGAKPDADISQALLGAWKEAAAATTPGVIVIPQGTWPLTQVKLLGPNKAPLELQVQGTVKAPPNPSDFVDKAGEWITINYVNQFTLSGTGVFDGQGQEAWKQNDCAKNQNCAKLPINLSLNFINNSIIQDVTTKDSKNFHVNCIASSNVTFLRFKVSAPGDSPNTDGLHLARVTDVSVTDSIIETGDDCISIGDETTNINIQNVTCGPGHGISIGSLGKVATEKDVKGVSVKNCTFINTQNGIRIKTWPSSPATLIVSGLIFENLIMNNASNPIIIDQEYCPSNQCKLDKPSLIKISNVSVTNVVGTSFTPEAVTFACSSSTPCDNVQVGDIDLKLSGPQGPITSPCKNVKPTFVGKQNPPVCAGAPAPAAPPA